MHSMTLSLKSCEELNLWKQEFINVVWIGENEESVGDQLSFFEHSSLSKILRT